MKLSILIPVYNEQETISKIIALVKRVKLGRGFGKEIIVINDASTDQTVKILNKLKGIRIYNHKRNKGKGAAINLAFKKATGDMVVIQDADLEYDPKYLPKLIEVMKRKKADVVYGSRLKNYPLRLTGKKRTPLALHYLGNKFLSLITRLIYGVNITDMETGYKMIKKEFLEGINIKSQRFDLEPELTAKLIKSGAKIVETPIRTIPRGYNEGKKITWKDGIAALWSLIKYRFVD
jgi:glycosyltransferase involved in cell wall biosynthesis